MRHARDCPALPPVLADGAPLAFAEVGPPLPPGNPLLPRFIRPLRLGRLSLTVIAERIYRRALVGPAVLWPDQATGRFRRCRGRPMTRSAGSGPRRSARVRCAIYTRKSSEEGLQQEFNSLLAQREACEAFINSQRHEGWTCLRAAYDDGGFSGATLDRPALQRLLADIAAGRIDTVVVYKIDRLTRSLAAATRKCVTAHGVTLPSVRPKMSW